jgi:hypothetical protein
MIVGAGEVAMAFYSAVVLALLDERNETRLEDSNQNEA